MTHLDEARKLLHDCGSPQDQINVVAEALRLRDERIDSLRLSADKLQVVCCRICADWTPGQQNMYGLREAVDELRNVLEEK